MKSTEIRERLKDNVIPSERDEQSVLIDKAFLEYLVGIIEGLEDDKELYLSMLSETQLWALNRKID